MIIPDNLIRIVAAGGGLIIDLKKQIVIPDVLVKLAAAAATSGATITIKNADGMLIPEVMIRIAIAGNGRVVFEL